MTNIHKIWSKTTKGDTKYIKYYILHLTPHLALARCQLSFQNIYDGAQLMYLKRLANKFACFKKSSHPSIHTQPQPHPQLGRQYSFFHTEILEEDKSSVSDIGIQSTENTWTKNENTYIGFILFLEGQGKRKIRNNLTLKPHPKEDLFEMHHKK